MADLTYAQGSLTIPRVKVVWGPEDITQYVYDVRVSLDEQGQTPSGSMKWIPTPEEYAKYEDHLKKYEDWSIMISFYYVGGNSITFEFYWGGQSEIYGNQMEITVKLVSLLDGLINANFFANAQTYINPNGAPYTDALNKMLVQFGITGAIGSDGRLLNIIRYTNKAKADLESSLVFFNYNDGATFSEAAQNLVKDNGNNIFFNNIDTANAVIFTPYTWENNQNNSVTIDNGVKPRSGSPDPRLRYAYFLGPGIIQTFTRTYEWQPPQKSQEITAMMNRKIDEIRIQSGKKARNRQISNAQGTGLRATSPVGIYGSNTSQNIRSFNNTNGPIKQDLFTKERSAKLSVSTLMCPALVGVKPLDILFIPNYQGTYIEDWIVSSVEYQQNDKGIELSIQATRTLGIAEPMAPLNSQEYQTYANNLGLVGSEGSTKEDKLINWVYYAWKTPLNRSQPLTGSPQGIPQVVSTGPDPSQPAVSKPSPDVKLTLKRYEDTIRGDRGTFDPTKVAIRISNETGLKAPGYKLNPYSYLIKDRAYFYFLEETLPSTADDKIRLFAVESSIPGADYAAVGVTGEVSLNSIAADYAKFLPNRENFIQFLLNRGRAKYGLQTVNFQPFESSTLIRTAQSPLLITASDNPATTPVVNNGVQGTGGTTQTNNTSQGGTPNSSATGLQQNAIAQPIESGTNQQITPLPKPVQGAIQTGGLSLDLVKFILQNLPQLASSREILASSAIAPTGSNSVVISDIVFADWLILKNKQSPLGGAFNINDGKDLFVIDPATKRYVNRELTVTGGNLNQIRQLYTSKEYQYYVTSVKNYKP
jgi:hypothetical protein